MHDQRGSPSQSGDKAVLCRSSERRSNGRVKRTASTCPRFVMSSTENRPGFCQHSCQRIYSAASRTRLFQKLFVAKWLLSLAPHPTAILGVALPMNPAARTAPAAARNREPILQVLRDCMPRTGLVLEVASGTGEHAVWFSRALPGLTWQPTDQDPDALESIAAWRDLADLPNLLPPLAARRGRSDLAGYPGGRHHRDQPGPYRALGRHRRPDRGCCAHA